jgi:hypothetical protein
MIIEMIIEGARGNIGRTLPEFEGYDILPASPMPDCFFCLVLIVCR